MRILLLDDNEFLRSVIAETLELDGHEVSSAASSQEAEALVGGDLPDCLVVDSNLGQESGLDFIRRWREREAREGLEPPVCILAIGGTHDEPEAREAGATGWLAKPFSPDQLEALLREHLGDITR